MWLEEWDQGDLVNELDQKRTMIVPGFPILIGLGRSFSRNHDSVSATMTDFWVVEAKICCLGPKMPCLKLREGPLKGF